MIAFFIACAALGGAVLLLQLVLGLVGGDVDVDTDVDLDVAGHDGFGSGLDLLSMRTLAAALAFFGVAGAGALSAGWPRLLAVPAAIVAGLTAGIAVSVVMRSLKRLEDDGSERIENAVGVQGTVYLRIPGRKAGVGKVHLPLQGRTVELQAVTDAAELAPGTPVMVVEVVNADTVEVIVPPTLGELIDGHA